ncbi:MAG: site-specific integrase [Firmicutes bacterium]|nr:site-specific integrase [Bacillota bacterium]
MPRGEKGRRGRGEGSVFQRSDGLWVAMGSYLDAQGKRRRPTVYGSTKQEALKKLAKILQEAGKLPEPEKITTGQYLQRWLQDAAASTLRPTTLSSYRYLVESHITPEIGRVPLQKLQPLHIQHLLAAKQKAGLSLRTCEYIYAVLHRALEQAVRWKLVPSNPADAVDKPRPPHKEKLCLSREQVQKFLDAAKEDRFYALYVLALATGMRQGELLGLQWQDIDMKEAILRVRRKVYSRKELEISEPKTAAGLRAITLPPIAVDALRQHRERLLAEGLAASPWVFPDTAGGPMRASNLLRRSFKPLLKAAGLPDIRFQDLRHTSNTLLAEAGVDPRTLQQRLGHASPQLTLSVYTHVTANMQREAAAKMQEILSPKNPSREESKR